MHNASEYLRLTRIAETPTETLGTLEVRDNGQTVYRCVCTELPDKGNENRISRIPTGTYELRQLEESPAFGYRHFWIVDVPGRSGIKIHIANLEEQLEGCVAPGLRFARVDGDRDLDVTRSEDALHDLLTELPTRTKIVVRDRPDLDTAALEDLPETTPIRELTPA